MTGKAYRPDEALKLGLVDAVVADELLEQAAADLVKKCLLGKFDWQAKRQENKYQLSSISWSRQWHLIRLRVSFCQSQSKTLSCGGDCP